MLGWWEGEVPLGVGNRVSGEVRVSAVDMRFSLCLQLGAALLLFGESHNSSHVCTSILFFLEKLNLKYAIEWNASGIRLKGLWHSKGPDLSKFTVYVSSPYTTETQVSKQGFSIQTKVCRPGQGTPSVDPTHVTFVMGAKIIVFRSFVISWPRKSEFNRNLFPPHEQVPRGVHVAFSWY